MSNTENRQSLRIFTIISQIEQLIESAPRPKFGGGGRRLIDMDEIFDLIGDLKVTIPEDIRRANSVLIEADTLLEHANNEAYDLVDNAQHNADELLSQAEAEAAHLRSLADQEFEARVSEDKVLLEVQRRAEMLQEYAERNANIVYDGAKQYADDILIDVQQYLLEYHSMVEQNRAELGVKHSQPVPKPAQQQPEPVLPEFKQPKVYEEEQAHFEEQLNEEDPIPRRRLGWFRKKTEDDYFEDEADFSQADLKPSPKYRADKHSQREELDLDLDE